MDHFRHYSRVLLLPAGDNDRGHCLSGLNGTVVDTLEREREVTVPSCDGCW